MSSIVSKVWFWPAVALAVLVVLTKGSVLAAAAPLYKFLVPVAVVWGGAVLLRRAVRKKFQSVFEEVQRAQQNIYDHQRANYAGGDQSAGEVIEICPKCGSQKESGHRC